MRTIRLHQRVVSAAFLTVGVLMADVAYAQNADSRASVQRIRNLVDTRAAKHFDEIVSREFRKQQLVGLAIGVIRDGKIVYAAGYGMADAAKRRPVDRSTLFRWASISKPITAVAAMQLVERGKLDLDRDVRVYVPEFPDHGARVTCRHLLCHQSGIVHYTNGKVVRTRRQYGTKHPFENVILALDTFVKSPLIARPGTEFHYSTHAFILLSAAVQRAGKQKFATQVRERIVKPLGMTTLQPDYQWLQIRNRAVGYRRNRGNGKIEPDSDTDVSWKLGGGGFLSNVEDLARFATGLINGKLVSRKTQQEMWKPHPAKGSRAQVAALGFFVSGKGNNLVVQHSGAQEKTRTHMIIMPRRKIGVVVMSNCTYAKPRAFSRALMQVLLKRSTVTSGN